MILEGIKFSNSFFVRNLMKIIFICAIPILFISIFQLTIDPLPWNNLSELSFTTLLFQSFNILFQITFLSLSILLINDLSNNKSQTIVNYLFKSIFFVPTLTFAYFFVATAVSFGIILFILPGVYLLGRFIYLPFVVVLENRKFLDSLKVAQSYAKEEAWLLGTAAFFLYFIYFFITITFGSIFFDPEKDIIPPKFLFFIYLSSFLFQIYFNIFVYSLYKNREIK
tara:strand:- start:535 stop:1209 length:675 start_codon:yes stop_codon:yes gene_type:complete